MCSKKSYKAFIYSGPSMYPLFKNADKINVIPFNKETDINIGDVIIFIPPGNKKHIIHRVISINTEGIKTQGDNCSQPDNWILKPENIIGKVIKIEMADNKQKVIHGGFIGNIIGSFLRMIPKIKILLFTLIRPFYRFFSRFLFLKINPRIVRFNRKEGTEIQLLIGNLLVGKRRAGKRRYWIRPPFKLFIDEAKLPC